MTEKECNILEFEYETKKRIMKLPRKEFENEKNGSYIKLMDAYSAISEAKIEVEKLFDTAGTWKFNNNVVNRPWCSECGCDFLVPVGDLVNYCFCPSCGSKMMQNS